MIAPSNQVATFLSVPIHSPVRVRATSKAGMNVRVMKHEFFPDNYRTNYGLGACTM